MTVVHHFGPDPNQAGGISTVIGLLVEHDIGADSVRHHTTWRPHSHLANLVRLVRCSLTLLRIPRRQIVHIHLSEKGSFVREGWLLILARRRNLITVATLHGASFGQFAEKAPRLVAEVLRRADLVTCLDREAIELVRRSAPLVHAEILPNPVWIADRAVPADETGELVVFAGEIGLRKGADILVSAWRQLAERHPQARCLMIGPVADYLPPATHRLEVREPVDRAEIADVLDSARVIALPARAEAMPMILAEAMSHGRPFVSTAVGGVPELASAGGILVPVDDDVGLADRLSEFLSSPDLAREVGERGRAFCIKTRSIRIIDERLGRLYAIATSAHSTRGAAK